jgi:stage II sporulation protein D
LKLLPLALLLLGCSRAEHADPMPLHARFVRVHLKSLGDWKQIEVTGKGGLLVGNERVERFVLKRDDPRALILRAELGILTVAGRSYSGDLLWRHGKLINNVPLENYVLGVLRGELPLKKVPVAAAAAQAIAVRSYTLHYVKQHAKVFDVDDTTRYQVYSGLRYAPDDDALRAGVQATVGLYLMHDGAPLKAYYHSTCGGHTTNVPTGLNRDTIAPMTGVPCDFCKISKYWRWTATLPYRRIEVVDRGPGGRARRLRVDGKLMAANAFRMRAGPSKLRSTKILDSRPARNGRAVEISGAGWGHGVGLCQMGAIGRATENWSAERIVKYYYPGAALVRAK